jgi:hypothetical protein
MKDEKPAIPSAQSLSKVSVTVTVLLSKQPISPQTRHIIKDSVD